MIKIGLTGWGDHPSLYRENAAKKDKLFDYSAHFPIVEVDTSFYAIPTLKNIEKWVEETPDTFQFIVKAYQGITGHQRDALPYETKQEMFKAFRECADAFNKFNKLAMVLVQFPPWFDCTSQNVKYILYVKQQLEGLPIAIEFRNQTWYQQGRDEATIQFLKEQDLIHTVCDEPQAGVGSVPFVPKATHKKVLVRLHGRNVYGWRNNGVPNWREVRFLYDYNQKELKELARHLQELEADAEEVYVLFNNNSGHDAAKNAKMLQKILNIQYEGLAPKQLNLFEGEF